MIKKVGALALVAAALFPLLASARHADVRDPNDSRGVLDVKSVQMLQGKPKWKVTTWARWKTTEIWDRGFAFVYLDTFGSGRADYYALVSSDGKGLRGALYRDRATGRDRRMRTVRTRHPRKNALNVVIPIRKLRRRDTGIFRWYALTMISGDRCKRFCFDRAPDTGSISEPGPAPTPTIPPPTPTIPPPTPTPTPTASP